MEDLRPLVLISGLATGGAERVTVGFLRRLAERGLRVPTCTVTRELDGPLAEELSGAGLTRHDLGARRLADPAALLRLLRLLERERYDLVHAHGQDAWILGAAGRALTGVPLVLTRHVLAEDGEGLRLRMRARCALLAARRADQLIAVSAATADRLAELTPLPRGRVRVIPNGIDLAPLDPPEPGRTRAAVRRSLGLDEHDSMILMPAVLRAGKGHETMLEALPLVRRRYPAARLVLAGSGEREGALRRRAGAAEGGVMFLGHRDDLPELLAACDLVAHPSWEEALPTALIEASAAGRAIVATGVGGTPEVVVNGRTGILVPPRDPGALADAIGGLLSEPERARRLGEAARRRARKRFSVDAQVDHTVALWRTVAGRQR